MGETVNIIELYANSDNRKRIEIIIDHYPMMEKMLDFCEQNLVYMVGQSLKMSRRKDCGELGVRVQRSGTGDPTMGEAITNMNIEEAIRSRDFSAFSRELDDDMFGILERELNCIDDIREDYKTFKDSFSFLGEDEALMLDTYLRKGRKVDKVSYEFDIKPGTFKVQMCRARSIVVNQTEFALNRKYWAS